MVFMIISCLIIQNIFMLLEQIGMSDIYETNGMFCIIKRNRNESKDRQGEMNLVSESRLYTLILTSRKNEAKHYKKRITHFVLPSIHNTGFQVKGSVSLISQNT